MDSQSQFTCWAIFSRTVNIVQYTVIAHLFINTHATRSRTRRHIKSTPFSSAVFRRRFFVLYTSGTNISGAENKRAWKVVYDEFAVAATIIIAGIVAKDE